MLEREFQLKPSRWFLALFGIIALLSHVILISLACPWSFKIIALIGTFIYCCWVCWRHGLLLGNDAIMSLRKQRDGRWHITTRTTNVTAVLDGLTTVTKWYAMLHFQVPEQRLRLSCLICRDALLVPHQYRQLIVTLRMC